MGPDFIGLFLTSHGANQSGTYFACIVFLKETATGHESCAAQKYKLQKGDLKDDHFVETGY